MKPAPAFSGTKQEFQFPEIALADYKDKLLQSEMDEIRLNILSTLKTIEAEHYSYHKAYTEILKLQLLTDVEKNKSLLQFLVNETDEAQCVAAVNDFFADWNARLCFLQATVRILEPLLCLRRNLLSETKNLLNTARGGEVSLPINKSIDNEMGKLWIRSIQLNREAGGLQQANLSIMKAEEYAPEALFVEKAKLLRQSGDQTKSLKLISEKISEIEPNGNISSQDKSNRLLYCEAKFLQATYSAESLKICAEQNLFYFKQAIAGNKSSEKCVVHMAQYLEKKYASKSDADKNSDAGRNMLFEIMGYYARAMKAGNESTAEAISSLARQRRLHIRTYAAIPFNEDCGLMEWLPNLTALRVIMSIYRSRKLGVADKELRTLVLAKEEKLEKKKQVFNTLLSRHPPVFHEWFIYQFSTPHNWYQARSSYIKTIAVMSMVGYILGLGDRHGENILFDETSGESVHVDFNCLFNKGESFNIPERVPFRLTQNMVHAMRPLGIEGLFRKCCEITLQVLQNQKKTLMSVLRPFVYDLSRLGKKTGNNIEKTDPQAMENVSRIEERLHGYVQRKGANRMPLSTEGQVEFLINEATDINNLAAMYAGWGPYL